MRSESNERNRTCMCCSCRSIELNQVHATSNLKDFQETDIGLVCIQCGQFICKHCINKIKEKLKTIADDVDPTFKHFVSNIMKFENSCNDLEEDYVGHCCIINNSKIVNYNYCHTKRKVEKNTDQLCFGGAFCIPEFDLMIQSSDECMDVFAIGHDTKQEPLLHYVLDEKCAKELNNNGYKPQMDMPADWISYEKELIITLPHVINQQNKKVSKYVMLAYYCLLTH